MKHAKRVTLVVFVLVRSIWKLKYDDLAYYNPKYCLSRKDTC